MDTNQPTLGLYPPGSLCQVQSYDDWLVCKDEGMTPIARCYATDGHPDPEHEQPLPAEDTAQLFASAPTLVAENERLRKVLGRVAREISMADGIPTHIRRRVEMFTREALADEGGV